MAQPSSQIRIAHLRALARVIAADGRVTADEVARLYETFALFDASEVERLELLTLLAFRADELAEPVDAELLGNNDSRVALAKDLMFLQAAQPDPETGYAVDALLAQIRLTAAQTTVVRDWIAWENRLLQRLGAGEEWTADSTPRELSARAAAVGLPVGALYFAGVTGLSAVGITSGLATIGTYTGLTLLGLNPMTAGIAGLVILGITAKKLADFLLGNRGRKASELAKQVQQIRDVHLRAATRLGQDLTAFERRAGRDGTDPARAAHVADAMRQAFALLEARAT